LGADFQLFPWPIDHAAGRLNSGFYARKPPPATPAPNIRQLTLSAIKIAAKPFDLDLLIRQHAYALITNEFDWAATLSK